jgi:hypothetical protein
MSWAWRRWWCRQPVPASCHRSGLRGGSMEGGSLAHVHETLQICRIALMQLFGFLKVCFPESGSDGDEQSRQTESIGPSRFSQWTNLLGGAWPMAETPKSKCAPKSGSNFTRPAQFVKPLCGYTPALRLEEVPPNLGPLHIAFAAIWHQSLSAFGLVSRVVAEASLPPHRHSPARLAQRRPRPNLAPQKL